MAQPGLRILVPIKRVIDYAVKPRFSKTAPRVDPTNLKHSMNPFDELSIEEAIRLRERGAIPVSEILTVSAGPAKTVDVLRTALAMGADRAIHIQVNDDPVLGDGLEPLTVAKLLHKIAQEEKVDVVLLGKQAIDDDAGQTGPMLAGLLGWPQVTQAAKLEIVSQGKAEDGADAADGESKGNVVTVTREVDGGVETIRTSTPVIVTTDLRLNQPRYANLQNIMKAKKKPLVKKELKDYGFPDKLGEHVRLKAVKIEEPPKRSGGVKVENVDGLIGKLKELGAL